MNIIRTVVLLLCILSITGAVLIIPVAAQTDKIKESEVALSGSTITVNTGGVNAIAIEDLPEGVTIHNVSASGTYNSEKRSILYSNFGEGLPATVTFTIDPDDNIYSANSDVITFAVDGNTVSLRVIGNKDSVDEGQDSSANNAAGGGGNGGTSESSETTESPTPADIESVLQLIEPQETIEIESGDTVEPTEGEVASDAEGEINGVKSVTVSGKTEPTITVENYGSPPPSIEEDVLKSINTYNNDVPDTSGNQQKKEADESVNPDGNGERNIEGDPNQVTESDTTVQSRESTRADSDAEASVVALARVDPSEDIDDETTAEVVMTIDTDDISKPDDLAVYKQEYVSEAQEERWIKLDSLTVENQGEVYRASTEVSEFSLFAAVEITDQDVTSTNSTKSTNSSNTDIDQTNESTPGFTILMVIITIIGFIGIDFGKSKLQ